jgi:hypothetical protein
VCGELKLARSTLLGDLQAGLLILTDRGNAYVRDTGKTSVGYDVGRKEGERKNRRSGSISAERAGQTDDVESSLFPLRY